MQMPDNFTKAVDRELYQQVLTEKEQSTLMIGIGVLAAVALFIVILLYSLPTDWKTPIKRTSPTFTIASNNDNIPIFFAIQLICIEHCFASVLCRLVADNCTFMFY